MACSVEEEVRETLRSFIDLSTNVSRNQGDGVYVRDRGVRRAD